MGYKHITDRRAQRRRYYRDHQEEIRQAAAEWYEANKKDPGFLERKRVYMRAWRLRKRSGA